MTRLIQLEEKRLEFEERQLERDTTEEGRKEISTEDDANHDGSRVWTTSTTLPSTRPVWRDARRCYG